MQVHIHIDDQSTANDLEALSVFAFELALGRGLKDGPAAPLTAPLDQAELPEPEPELVTTTSAGDTITEAPKRRRRTKAEIEAEAAAAAAAAAGEPAAAEPEAPATPLAETPASTPDAQQQATPPSETASTAPVSASPSDGATYTAADVQKMAVDAARRFGPEKVKALIAEYPNASKIADLKTEDLAGFVAKLEALSVE